MAGQCSASTTRDPIIEEEGATAGADGPSGKDVERGGVRTRPKIESYRRGDFPVRPQRSAQFLMFCSLNLALRELREETFQSGESAILAINFVYCHNRSFHRTAM